MKTLRPSEHFFDSIVGHNEAKSYLTTALSQDVLPHAMLFYGPAGVGKLSMVYALAKYINCPNNGPVACPCNVCRKIREEIFADILLIEPSGAAGQITLNGWRPGKDDPDNLQYYRFLDARPLEGSRKILILRHAEKMNVALANYILKVMEEPPSYLTLILVSNRRTEIMPTIRSRCAPVNFSPLRENEMLKFAEAAGIQAGISESALDGLIKKAEGRPGLLSNKIASDESGYGDNLSRIMGQFRNFGFLALFRTASDLLKANGAGAKTVREEFDTAVSLLNDWFRDAAIVKSQGENGKKFMVNPNLYPQISNYCENLSIETILNSAGLVYKYQDFSRRQTDKNYVIESLLMEIGRAMRG